MHYLGTMQSSCLLKYIALSISYFGVYIWCCIHFINNILYIYQNTVMKMMINHVLFLCSFSKMDQKCFEEAQIKWRRRKQEIGIFSPNVYLLVAFKCFYGIRRYLVKILNFRYYHPINVSFTNAKVNTFTFPFITIDIMW